MPRLLVTYYEAKSSRKPTSNHPPNDASLSKSTGSQQEYLREIERLTSLSILDFTSEQVASSITNLWRDITDEALRNDFLRFNKGWVGHVVLLGCTASKGVEVIEHVLEIACCLDLLCREHLIAVNVVESLKIRAISRLSIWKQVRPSLCHKMEEILKGRLAQGAPSLLTSRAPRDVSLEYWLLSRAYVNEENMLVESLRIETEETIGDVEQRINQLEQLLGAIGDGDHPEASSDGQDPAETDTHLSDGLALSETDTETEMSDDTLSSDEVADIDDLTPIKHIAQQTRERVSRHLESIKSDIQNRSTQGESLVASGAPSVSPTTQSQPRLVDLLDQRTMVRVGAKKDLIPTQRRTNPSATYPIDAVNERLKKSSDHRQHRTRPQDAQVAIPVDATGMWKRNGSRAK